jgi:hypothetical protein
MIMRKITANKIWNGKSTIRLSIMFCLGVSGLFGCEPREAPDEALIECSTDEECPTDWTCQETLNRCVKTEDVLDADPPAVIPESIQLFDENGVARTHFKSGAQIKVRFDTTRALSSDPRISLGVPFAASADGGAVEEVPMRLMEVVEDETNRDENRYMLSYAVSEELAEGSLTLYVELTDDLGTVAAATLSSVLLDFTAPVFDEALTVDFAEIVQEKAKSTDTVFFEATIEEGVSLIGAALVDDSGEELLVIPLGEDVSTADGGTIMNGIAIEQNIFLRGAADLSEATLADGSEVRIQVELADAAGNLLPLTEQYSPLFLIDDTPPGSPAVSIVEEVAQNIFARDITLSLSTDEGANEFWIEGDVVESQRTLKWVVLQAEIPITLTEGDGIKNISVKVRDLALNESSLTTKQTNLEASLDEDGDGCVDAEDANPLTFSADGDGDERGDDCDVCLGDDLSGDTDGDEICDDEDEDIDNDGCANDTDLQPLLDSPDADGDGFGDHCDLCEGNDVTGDTDQDLICDDLDEDKDGDGCADVADPAPLLFSLDPDGDHLGADCDLCNGQDSTGDTDSDGLCDDIDQDDDGDGCVDGADPAALAFSPDSDVDTFGDDCDLCNGDDATFATEMMPRVTPIWMASAIKLMRIKMAMAV